MLDKQFFVTFTIFVALIGFSHRAVALEAKCGRTAEINGENIAIDASTTQKGEGLRFYLTKDPEAKKYFDEYTESNKPNWKRIGVSTFGMGLIIGGFLSSNDTDNDFFKRDTLLVSGVTIVALSFVYAKTRQSEKEVILQKSINEYNKRNEPKILITPQYRQDNDGWGIIMSREF